MTSSTVVDPAPDNVLKLVDTFIAPEVLPIPEELRGLAKRMPDDGIWVRKSGREGPQLLKGVFFEDRLAVHIQLRLRALNDYPGICQIRIDEARAVSDAEKSAIKKVAAADCVIARIDDKVDSVNEGVSKWMEVLIGVGIGILVGVLVTR